MDRLCEAGIHDVLINTHALPEQVREYVERINRARKVRVVESYEPVLLGSAGTIAANAAFGDDADELVIIYADNLSDVPLGRLLAFHRSHGDPLTMLLFRAPDPKACGIAEVDSQGRILSFVEKPTQPKSDLANAGVYVATPSAYREIAAMRAFDLAFDVLPRFAGRMRGWFWNGYHLDIGTPETFLRARAEFKRHAVRSENLDGIPPACPAAAAGEFGEAGT
jgi:mannose-1-phosphate guanylyltransferase